MSETTNIGWTASTWNPWMGCEKVSPGCDNCYMFREQRQYGHDPEVVRRSKTLFDAPLKWNEPRVIFTCSWSDWFHKDADPWRDEAWDIIRRTPHHTYQILTKRPARIARHLPSDWGDGWPNVWLGVTVENQEWADRRIPVLLSIPARVRFLSCEPLIGPISFRWRSYHHQATGETYRQYLDRLGSVSEYESLKGIHWAIVGGESESDAKRRDMDPAWLASLVDQLREAGVKVFVKQDSARRSEQQGRIPDALWALKEMPR